MTSTTPDTTARFPAPPFPAWDDARASALDEPGQLLYRSNLLGSDLRITNYGGGNTSAKISQRDPLTGENVTCCGSRVPVATWVRCSSMVFRPFT